MGFPQFTPFRQVARAYGALLDIAEGVGALAAAAETGAPFNDLPAKDNEVALANPKYGLFDRMGFRLLLDQTSVVDKAVIDSGTWETDQLAYLSTLMERFRGRPGATFLDVGAYWGLYPLIAVRSGSFSRVVAFEADRNNLRSCRLICF